MVGTEEIRNDDGCTLMTLPTGFAGRFGKECEGEIKTLLKGFCQSGWCWHFMRWGRLQKEQFGIPVGILSEKLKMQVCMRGERGLG